VKQRIKIGCFIAAGSVIAGLVVYSGAWAMYRVADVLLVI
jgi:hypothetical protein